MDEVGIILLTLFLVLFICGPLYRPIRLTYLRVQEYRKYHPRSAQVEDARRKLSSVSEHTSIGPEKLDIESRLNQRDFGPECPICIGPLFASSPNASGSNGGGHGGVAEESRGDDRMQRGTGSMQRMLDLVAGRWMSMLLVGKKPFDKWTDDSGDYDIFRLKSCQHAFHAKCLSSWFLIERYDCPVCRSQYWEGRDARSPESSASPGPVSGPETTAHGSEIARPAPARLAVERLGVPLL